MTLALALLSPAAVAQSAALLEAVRLYRPGAAAMAQDELNRCRAKGCPDLSRLALLAGYLRLSDGDAQAARELFASCAPLPELRPYHAFYSGQAAFYAGDPAAAARSFLSALDGAPPSLVFRAKARAGEALLEAGDAAQALPLLDDAARQLSSPELYWERAMARGLQGDGQGRRDDLLRLAVDFPAHAYGERALELWAKEGGRALTFGERLERASLLLDTDARGSLAELARIRKDNLARSPVDAARAALLGVRANLGAGDVAAADRELKQAELGPQEIAAEAAYERARQALKAEGNERARALMQEIDRKYPRTAAAREAGFYVGWLSFQLGELDRAVGELRAYASREGRSRRRDEARWFEALCLILLQRHGEARGALQSLAVESPGSPLLPQALYWAARAQELSAAGDAAGVPAEYARIIELYPTSFYAVLASDRLRQDGESPPAAFPPLADAGQVQIPQPLGVAVELSRSGLFRDAALEISAQTARIRGEDEAILYGQALQRIGEYAAAYSVANRLLWGLAFTQKRPEALALFYPRPFEVAVRGESKTVGIDPYLTWSIMRRESSFRPELLSIANARGLMQMVPKTALAIASALKLSPPDADELFSPQLNVRFGTWYLGQLQLHFKHPALVAAAYNAGPPVAERWVRDHGKMPLDLFVELVSYRETRAYVKQVLADLYVYRALYEGKGVLPPLAGAVPAPTDQGVRF